MCGIWAYLQASDDDPYLNDTYWDAMSLKPRGPDQLRMERFRPLTLCFHRLAIMNTSPLGNQPFLFHDLFYHFYFVCNGEIYNTAELEKKYPVPYHLNDCHLLAKILWTHFICRGASHSAIAAFLQREVKGEFALLGFVFNESFQLQTSFASRDPIGVRPLYYGSRPEANGRRSRLFCSELKGATHYPGIMEEFPPGFTHFYDGEGVLIKADSAGRWVYETEPSHLGENDDGYYLQTIRDTVTEAVRMRLTADRPVVALLSGGVDSSLVCALAQRERLRHGGEPLHTVCCGMPAGEYQVNGGPVFRIGEGADLGFARTVAAHIGSVHHEVLFTPQEAIDAIPSVIRTIESWDTTTVRASVGQYMASRWIAKNMDAKVVLVGEGPDEVCSAYRFNEFAPGGAALHAAALEYVDRIHLYDGRRLDRCIARWGLEARVPLLDTTFIQAYWMVPTHDRLPSARGMEKWWLREAFNRDELLPADVLWRKKSAFSDSMTTEKSWYQILQDWAETQVTDAQLASAAERFPYCTPATKEAYVYRRIFCEVVGSHRQKVLPGYWQPKWNAAGQEVVAYMDPSALVLRP